MIIPLLLHFIPTYYILQHLRFIYYIHIHNVYCFSVILHLVIIKVNLFISVLWFRTNISVSNSVTNDVTNNCKGDYGVEPVYAKRHYAISVLLSINGHSMRLKHTLRCKLYKIPMKTTGLWFFLALLDLNSNILCLSIE